MSLSREVQVSERTYQISRSSYVGKRDFHKSYQNYWSLRVVYPEVMD